MAREVQHAEFIEIDGDTYSWYCTECSRELGADLAERGGEIDCPEHGREHVAWETWNVETDPSYPHDRISTDSDTGAEHDKNR